MTDLVVIDGCGANLTSLQNALDRLGANAVVSQDHAQIESAKRVILPGVGAAGTAMARLQEKGLASLVPRLKQPVLGICVGMQVLFESSEEDDAICLGVIQGRLEKIPGSSDKPVPHMGWNTVDSTHDLFAEIPTNTHFYFVHSYAARCVESTVASTNYGIDITAAAQRENFLGVQFHPERSGIWGAKLLANFLEWSPA